MRYALIVGFEASERLTYEERSALMLAVLAQIEDPASLDEGERRARYTTNILGAEMAAEDDPDMIPSATAGLA